MCDDIAGGKVTKALWICSLSHGVSGQLFTGLVGHLVASMLRDEFCITILARKHVLHVTLARNSLICDDCS